MSGNTLNGSPLKPSTKSERRSAIGSSSTAFVGKHPSSQLARISKSATTTLLSTHDYGKPNIQNTKTYSTQNE